MRELSLFTGAGGGVLGSKILGHTIVGYVEYENYCQKIIQQRIADGILDPAPIFGDIRKFISEGYADAYQGMVDIVTGGFPCQDISSANPYAKGIGGERSGLWKEMSDIIGVVRPKFVFVENSPMLTSRGGVRVIADLAVMGYDSKWGIISAQSVGAPHIRERMWIFSYTNKNGRSLPLPQGCNKKTTGGEAGFWGNYWNEIGSGHQDNNTIRTYEEIPKESSDKPWLYRVAHGVPNGLDRLNGTGNAQVPICMAYAYAKLSEGIVE